MWRLMLVVVAVGLGLAACGDDEVDVEEFYRRIKALQSGTFTVSYDMETISKSETEVRDLVWYRDGTSATVPLVFGKGRLDQSGDFGFLIEIDAETSYKCGGNDEERGCVVAPYGGPGEPAYWFVEPALNRKAASVVNSRSDSIVGFDVECYELEIDSSVPYRTYEVCLSQDGLLLAGTTGPFEAPGTDVDGMVIRMIAVDAKTEVADDAFEPPYPVIDRP